jgi:uncharacterized protein YndB with AHSA1/START domain
MLKNIQHQFYLPHPPEHVWEFLTNSELLAQWLMPNDFKPIVGHQFQFGTKPKIKLGFDGRVYCEVLEVEQYKKLVYSWKGGITGKKPLLDTIVTWTIEPKDGGTLLSMEHAGFYGFKNILPHFIMGKGWLKIGKRMLKSIEKKKNAN